MMDTSAPITMGMNKELYNALVLYLTSLKYVPYYDEKQRKAIRCQAVNYEVINGELFKRATKAYPRRWVVATDKVMSILKENHDHWMAGHQGVQRTFDRIKMKYYWPGYYNTVREYVQACQICQSFGPKLPPAPLYSMSIPQRGPFEIMMIDYISLPLSNKGFNAALVGIDMYSGWVEVKPTPNQTASTTGVFLYEWICRLGMPARILSDNGPHFNAQELKAFMLHAYGLEITMGAAYHPQMRYLQIIK
ncbi:hypothetical protein G6F37_013601 [Rhizopus arrhizus]|nr:hypothetical protein G6F38_013623 [Rhizopus arrhizus]KAG1137076.1 hypothetical protein G6F37_013601 [Rhizopus arrhizus]